VLLLLLQQPLCPDAPQLAAPARRTNRGNGL